MNTFPSSSELCTATQTLQKLKQHMIADLLTLSQICATAASRNAGPDQTVSERDKEKEQ